MSNGQIPQERVALNVIQSYDKIAEENRLLRDIVRELRGKVEAQRKELKTLRERERLDLSESVARIYRRGYKAAKNDIAQALAGLRPRCDGDGTPQEGGGRGTASTVC